MRRVNLALWAVALLSCSLCNAAFLRASSESLLQSSSAVQQQEDGDALQDVTALGAEKGVRKHKPLMKRKVVITGMGVVNGVGIGVEEFWNNLLNGKSGITKVERFDLKGHGPCTVACEIKDTQFDASKYYKDPKEVKRNDRYTNYAVAASKMAIEDGGLDTEKMSEEEREMFGVLVGSGIGGFATFDKQYENAATKGYNKVSPFFIPAVITNTAAGLIAIEFGAKGPNFGLVSACATGSHAIGEALRYVQSGRADIMLAGGSEAGITPMGFAGFNNMKAMAQGWNDEPSKASRPFDKKRSGFVMGEGAGVLLLESEEHALKRGARIYAELAGYAATCDANHITAPDPEGRGLARALTLAMEDGETLPEEVGYINAHGTSTPMNDKFETLAIKKAFGETLARQLKISSTKSMTGHCLGAAGGLEAIVAAKALETQEIPPTINYEHPDPLLDLNYVPNKKVSAKNDKGEEMVAAISDNLGFGGHNAALVFRKYTPSPEFAKGVATEAK